jgi:hypothetical protein
MRPLKNSILALIFAAACFAQSAEQLESDAVNRVAAKLECPCGCKMDMTCKMDPYPCPVCSTHKKKIFNMQQAGMTDDQILSRFAEEEGKDIIGVHPGVIGSLLSYTALGLGLILVVFVIRRYHRPQAPAAPASDQAVLDRYHEQIEKEVDKLD